MRFSVVHPLVPAQTRESEIEAHQLLKTLAAQTGLEGYVRTVPDPEPMPAQPRGYRQYEQRRPRGCVRVAAHVRLAG